MNRKPVVPILGLDPAPRTCCGAVRRIQVLDAPLGGSWIAWELHPTYRVRGPLQIWIEFAYAGSDVWEPVHSLPIVDDCLAVDPHRRRWDHLAHHSYRLRLVQPENIDPDTGLCVQCVSEPQHAGGLWDNRDRLIARDIMRREHLAQFRRHNRTDRGLLLKRRRWGRVCPRCADWDTAAPADGHCPVCFGTGFFRGYFPAIGFTFTLRAPYERGFRRNTETGVTNDVVRVGRAPAWMWLDSGDVYVREMTGERYVVQKIDTVGEHAGIPVVVEAELRLEKTTDVIYRIPLSPPPEEVTETSSSLPGPDACGPTAVPGGGGDW